METSSENSVSDASTHQNQMQKTESAEPKIVSADEAKSVICKKGVRGSRIGSVKFGKDGCGY